MNAALAFCVSILAPLGLWRWLAARREADWLQDQLEQLASAVEQGLPLHVVLGAMADEASSQRLTRRLRASADAAQASGSLAAAVDARPRWCPADLRALIHAGEAQGTLAACLALARDELAEGPALRVENLQRVGYPALLIASVLWLALFLDEVVVAKFRVIGEVYGARVWSEEASLSVTALLAILSVVLGGWLLALLSASARRLLLALGRPLPGLRGWIACRQNASWLGRTGALLGAGEALAPALRHAAALGGGALVERAAALAEQGAPLEQALAAGLGPAGQRDLPRLLLVTRAHGLGPGLRLYAERLRGESRRRLGWIGDVVQPLPTLLCGAVACGMAWGVFGALQAIQGLILLRAPGDAW